MDSSVQSLLPFLANTSKKTLLIADENALHLNGLENHPLLKVITNRLDVHQQFEQQKIASQFSDFDFSGFEDASIDQVLYRVSKEKPVVNHVINQSLRVLKPQGVLFLAGQKNDGIKTYTKKAGKLFNCKEQNKKERSHYSASIVKNSEFSKYELLDDQNYSTIREIHSLNGVPVFSKPGLFGWNKIDRGSELLIQTAEPFIEALVHKPTSCLDLGCGYGYLTLATETWPSIKTRTATDNNAAALACMQHNTNNHNINVDVVAADCAIGITQVFDLILCNPPFHQGFDVDSNLTEKFLTQASKRLNKGGVALFVVNQFIGLNKYGKKYFPKIEEIANNGSFKVIALFK
jgi:16S rRNA (guanine1207-N2)-methyltransferase